MRCKISNAAHCLFTNKLGQSKISEKQILMIEKIFGYGYCVCFITIYLLQYCIPGYYIIEGDTTPVIWYDVFKWHLTY